MKSVCEVLNNLSTDKNCKLVLLLAANDTFCNGLDYLSLIQPTAEKRKSAAKELAGAVMYGFFFSIHTYGIYLMSFMFFYIIFKRNFFHTIATFKKPIVAGVSGHAVGIGVTFLPLFDMVFASDKASFETNYNKIGQIPEGCSILSSTNRVTELFVCYFYFVFFNFFIFI